MNSFGRLTAGNNDILLLTNKEQNASVAMLLKLGSKGNWQIGLLAEHCDLPFRVDTREYWAPSSLMGWFKIAPPPPLARHMRLLSATASPRRCSTRSKREHSSP